MHKSIAWWHSFENSGKHNRARPCANPLLFARISPAFIIPDTISILKKICT